MKALALLVISLSLAGCYTAPVNPSPRVVVVDKDGKSVSSPPQVIVVREYPYYPSVSWHIGIGFGRGHYRPGPWRHHRHW